MQIVLSACSGARLLHETIAKERVIDAELDKLLGKRAELERTFLLLNTPTAEVSQRRSGQQIVLACTCECPERVEARTVSAWALLTCVILPAAPQTLELVHADCEQLLAGAQSTAQLADHISGKVMTGAHFMHLPPNQWCAPHVCSLLVPAQAPQQRECTVLPE